MKIARIIILILVVLAAVAVGYWYLANQNKAPQSTPLSGSGTVETTEVTISPEISGKVAEIFVGEGDQVQVGQQLFNLDDALLSAQLSQAQAALDAAQAGLVVARDSYTATLTGVDIAQAQYDLALAQSLQQYQPARTTAWDQAEPSQFDLPSWYYTNTEQLAAALDELNASRAALDSEQTSFTTMQSSTTYTNLVSTEVRLAKARQAFLDAQDVLNRAEAQGNQSLVDAAQAAFDTANSELSDAQSVYADLLTTQQANDILDARARLAVAQERLDTAQDRYNALQVGKDSPQVKVAAAALVQAQSNVTMASSKVAQAQTAIDQAQASVDLVTRQIDKLVVSAPVAGVVLTRNIEPGEMVQAGASALTLGELDKLTITVYISENRYGEVHLGDKAQVTVDSFPDQPFAARVTRIADQAEFTPRNVQTVEGRSTTVFAVQLAVTDTQGRLKPGMPADVTFTQP